MKKRGEPLSDTLVCVAAQERLQGRQKSLAELGASVCVLLYQQLRQNLYFYTGQPGVPEVAAPA